MSFQYEIKGTLQIHYDRVEFFERDDLQHAASKIVPYRSLIQNATLKLSQINQDIIDGEKPMDLQDCLVAELLSWFKKEFFQWFNGGFCNSCNTNMKHIGYLNALPEESEFGGHRVEGYVCETCGNNFRFPRYFHPGKLLETRTGRCMEWASCFTLICRALKIEARYTWDRTDHVWTEVFSHSQDRWMHTDPCENKMDTPLLYETGWGKELSYVFAFSYDEIVDVALRYTSDPAKLCSRRTSCQEDWLASAIQELNERRNRTFTPDKRMHLEKRRVKEIAGFFSPSRNAKEGESEGRLSGSLAWRLSRNEMKIAAEDNQTRCVFSPLAEEIQKKEMLLKYSPSKDVYQRPLIPSVQELKGWRRGAFNAQNIFRKHEPDWKMVYLCRKDGGCEGEISWKFDWSNSELRIKSVLVVVQNVTFENGSVLWQICNGESCFLGDSRGVLEVSKDLNDRIQKLEITATLQGGSGDVGWQHAQLFRQTDQDTKFPFFVHIIFK